MEKHFKVQKFPKTKHFSTLARQYALNAKSRDGMQCVGTKLMTISKYQVQTFHIGKNLFTLQKSGWKSRMLPRQK